MNLDAIQPELGFKIEINGRIGHRVYLADHSDLKNFPAVINLHFFKF